MPASPRAIRRKTNRLLSSGRAWIAVALLGSAAGLVPLAGASPASAAAPSSANSAVCASFETLTEDLIQSAPSDQIFKDIENLGEVAGQTGSSSAVTKESAQLVAYGKASTLTEQQLLDATTAIASACGHALGVNVSTVPIPSSLHLVKPPAGTTGPEVVPIPNGSPLASLQNAATGATVDGIQCNSGEQVVSHVHTHLTIFVNGQARVIPYGIGIPGFQAQSTKHGDFVDTGSCFYWLHTHADDGIIHVESPSRSVSFTLGQFFDEWGIPLSTSRVGPATGKVTVFFSAPGQKPALYQGNPRKLPLGNHYEIQLDVGSPIVAPVQVTNWGGL